MTSARAVERSIDSLQRIYAVIIALAINEAVKRLFLTASGQVDWHHAHWPEFVTFLITAVPFLQGMNRHLDNTLATSQKENRQPLLILVLFDFAFFLIESIVLFLMAISVNEGPHFFQIFMWLLIIDAAWFFCTFWFTTGAGLAWLVINILAAVLVVSTVLLFDHWEERNRMTFLAVIAVLRTLLDYAVSWHFYFPHDKPNNAAA